MRDGFIRKKVQKVVSKTGVQIILIRSQLHEQSVSLEAGSKITPALFRVGGYCKVDIC